MSKEEIIKFIRWIQEDAPYCTDTMMELTPEEIVELFLINQNKDD